MRKSFVALIVAASLAAASVPALHAQIPAPLVRPPAPPIAERPGVAMLPPGQASPFLFTSDDDLDAILPPGIQRDAWLMSTPSGRWWVWDDGRIAPADRRAEAYQDIDAGEVR
jgi:hypothetical protein